MKKTTTYSFKRKRLFDILFSLCVLTFCLPVLLCISLLIIFSTRSISIFFAHPRIGRGGKPFYCYKFRTMYPDADKRLRELLQQNSSLRKEWQENRKLKHDPRVTPIGLFLRKTSLDELPQFWNVLKGDLSVVGPRPVVREELRKHFGPKAKKILSVRPGITGIWQTSGRSHTSYSQRIQLDEKYIDTHSIALDLKLIAKTIPKILAAKDAY